MAVWQFDMHLIPRSKVIGVCGSIPDNLSGDSWNEVDWWAGYQPTCDYRRLLDTQLSEVAWWTDTVKVWGSEEGDRVDIDLDDDCVEGIHVRVDVRNLDPGFIQLIVRLAEECDCLLWTDGNDLIEPHVDPLYSLILQSPSWLFVQDPKNFFEMVKRGEFKVKYGF